MVKFSQILTWLFCISIKVNIFATIRKDRIMEPDYILIAKLNASSKQAFGQLYDKYVGMVYSFVCSLVRDESVAEDITQTVFVQLWEHRSSISSEKNLPAWLYVTARNAVFKELRRMMYMEKYVDYASRIQPPQEAVGGGKMDSTTIRKELESIISTFPQAMKNIYLLRTVEGLSVSEIAQMLDLSPKTVETQLARAKKKIQEKLKNF